jgi:hypothetical protein
MNALVSTRVLLVMLAAITRYAGTQEICTCRMRLMLRDASKWATGN